MEVRLVDLTGSKDPDNSLLSYILTNRREVSIGLGLGNNVCISPGLTSTVSRKHCKLYLNNGQVMIEDLGSKNGTYVNGQLIPKNRKVVLDKSVKINLGRKYKLRLDIVEDLELKDIEDSLDLKPDELRKKMEGTGTEVEIDA